MIRVFGMNRAETTRVRIGDRATPAAIFQQPRVDIGARFSLPCHAWPAEA